MFCGGRCCVPPFACFVFTTAFLLILKCSLRCVFDCDACSFCCGVKFLEQVQANPTSLDLGSSVLSLGPNFGFLCAG